MAVVHKSRKSDSNVTYIMVFHMYFSGFVSVDNLQTAQIQNLCSYIKPRY